MVLYRPVGTEELKLIEESGYRGFPPRLPEQPIFYPVLHEDYAREIARGWNVKYNRDHRGYVTRFEIDDEYFGRFEVRRVGKSYHEELWVLAEELEEFNRHILGRIQVIGAFGEKEGKGLSCGKSKEERVTGESELRRAGIHIISLADRPEMKDRAAGWFHEKWGIPLAAYVESMEECLAGNGPVPQWFLAVSGEGQEIVGGLGVIENDFHNRRDLTPNVCAVYTEERWRCRGVAGALLERVCRDMKGRGIDTLYLLTDHTSFYERYGWEFFCMVQGDGETRLSRMYIHRG